MSKRKRYTMFILFYVDDNIEANPCLQNGPRRRKYQLFKFIDQETEGRSGQISKRARV